MLLAIVTVVNVCHHMGEKIVKVGILITLSMSNPIGLITKYFDISPILTWIDLHLLLKLHLLLQTLFANVFNCSNLYISKITSLREQRLLQFLLECDCCIYGND